jgi:DnaJ-class molecular chaperone
VVRKETCPVCKGNKVVSIERSDGRADWRTCQGCNGTGFQVRVVHGAGLPFTPGTYGPVRG